MAASLLQNLVAAPAAYTLEDGYNVFIESMVDYIRNDPSTESKTISPEESYHNRFTLNRFLLRNGVPLEDHRLIMRVNRLWSVHDFGPHVTHLLIPNTLLIDRLKQMYRTRLSA